METAGVVIGAILGLAIGLLILFLLSLVFRWLWNTTLPEVFNVKSITTWQAFKIMLIAAMLFGGHRTVVVPSPQEAGLSPAALVQQP